MEGQQPYSNIDIVITGNVAWRDDLAWDVKIFYGIIRGLVKNDYYCCYASNEYLCKVLQKGDDRTVRRYINALKQAGVIVTDNIYLPNEHGKYFYSRAIVPTELYKKFEQKKNEMLDLKGSLKKCPMGGQKCPPTPGKNVRPYINNTPCKENSEAYINPQTPLQGGEQAVTLFEPEQEEVLGKFGNVRLTESQKAAFKSEFGSEMLSSLVEQLDSYIQSDGRRQKKFAKRSTGEFYANLRDWALRRRQSQEVSNAVVGCKIERRQYSDNDIEALFTPLDEDADDG